MFEINTSKLCLIQGIYMLKLVCMTQSTWNKDFCTYLFSDGYAPFLSMTSRETFLNISDQVVAAPGPGHYDPAFAQDNIKVSSVTSDCTCG